MTLVALFLPVVLAGPTPAINWVDYGPPSPPRVADALRVVGGDQLTAAVFVQRPVSSLRAFEITFDAFLSEWADAPDYLRDAAALRARLGFDPYRNSGWRSVGVSPRYGAGVVLDARLPGRPVLIARRVNEKPDIRVGLQHVLGEVQWTRSVPPGAWLGMAPSHRLLRIGRGDHHDAVILTNKPTQAADRLGLIEFGTNTEPWLDETSLYRQACRDEVGYPWFGAYVQPRTISVHLDAIGHPDLAAAAKDVLGGVRAVCLTVGNGGVRGRAVLSAPLMTRLQTLKPTAPVPDFAQFVGPGDTIFRVDARPEELARLYLALGSAPPLAFVKALVDTALGRYGLSLDALSSALTGHFAGIVSEPDGEAFLLGVEPARARMVLARLVQADKLTPTRLGAHSGHVIRGTRTALVQHGAVVILGTPAAVKYVQRRRPALPRAVLDSVQAPQLLGVLLPQPKAEVAEDWDVKAPYYRRGLKRLWGPLIDEDYFAHRITIDVDGLDLGNSMGLIALIAAAQVAIDFAIHAKARRDENPHIRRRASSTQPL